MADPEGKPLMGKKFCSTGLDVDIRNEIANDIVAMGGHHNPNLTTEVQYMIVGSRDTPKYEFAVKNRPDMAFLRPSFIPELFRRWQSAGNLDKTETELKYGQLDVFEGLKLCITNISDRKELIDLVAKYGGVYSAELTRDVTHLISGAPTGKKFKFAKKWEVFTVHQQWLHDSIRRKATLWEEFYDIEMPTDKIGVGACKQWPDEFARLKEESEEKVTAVPKRMKKRKIEFSQVWDSVLAENANSDRAKVVDEHGLWNDRDDSNAKPVSKVTAKEVNGKKAAQRMFAGHSFAFKGYDENKLSILEAAIKSHGGAIEYKDPTFCIINSELQPESRPKAPQNAVKATEWMIERSMHKKQLLMDQWGLVLSNYNIPGFDSLNIHCTGFSGVEALHIPKLVRILGGKYQQSLETKLGQMDSTDLLVISSANPKESVKVKLCKKSNIPMVNENWLFQCAEKGLILPLDNDGFVMFDDPEAGRIIRRRSADAQTLLRIEKENQSPAIVRKEPKKDTATVSLDSIQEKLAKKPKSERRKLVGRAITSNLTTLREDSSRQATPFDEEPPMTQVSYNDPETAKDHQKLMEALGTKPEKMKSAFEMAPAIENAQDRKKRLRNRG